LPGWLNSDSGKCLEGILPGRATNPGYSLAGGDCYLHISLDIKMQKLTFTSGCHRSPANPSLAPNPRRPLLDSQISFENPDFRCAFSSAGGFQARDFDGVEPM
jgi:hypothetical protein